MPYKTPTDGEAIDALTDAEFAACHSERDAIAKGRRKAYREHRATGPAAQLRGLSQGAVGDSILLSQYTRTGAISPLLALVSVDEGCAFSSRLERSLIDGAPVGVRVTLTGFTR